MSARPERRSGRPLLLLAPATLFEGYDTLVLSLALPLVRAQFNLTLQESGFLVSTVFAGSFGAFVLMPLADRIGRKPILMVTIVGYSLCTFLTAFTGGIASFLACQLAARVFMSAENALATIVIVEATEPERRGRALGVLSSMSALGQAAAGGGFLLVLTLHGSWRALYLAGLLPLLLFARARSRLSETGLKALHPSAVLRRLPRDRLVGATLLSFFIAVYPAAITTLASTLVLGEWRLTLSAIRPWYLGVWILAVSGFFVSGRLMDRIGRRPTSIAFFSATAAAGWTAFTASSTLGRVIGLGLVVFTVTGSTPCLSAYSTELFPNGVRGTVGAWLQGMGILGATLAPTLTAGLAVRLGSLGFALAVVSLTYLAGALVALVLLPETRGLGEDTRSAEAPSAP